MRDYISWAKQLLGYKVRFNHLEKLVLQSVREELNNAEIISLWDKQISAITSISRVINRESNLYREVNGKVCFDESNCFPNKKEELLLARLKLQFPTLGKLNIKVWIVKGHLFSIEYGKEMTEFEKYLSNPNNEKITVTCKILADLSVVQK